MTYSRRPIILVFALLCVCHQSDARADGSVIDKIYHPYVQPLEREIEFRAVAENNSQATVGDRRLYRLGYGQSLSERWLGEIYLIGVKNNDRGLMLDAYELETLWQITEQGEYFADWGLLVEAEKLRTRDSSEISTALLVEKEWRRWTGTMNLYGIYEFGADIANEFDTELALQARYRHTRALEPAVELYAAENTLGLGPVFTGSRRLGGGRQLYWEGGLILGLDSSTPDQTFKVLLEYEF
jgi:hypothetical protein